MQYYSGFEWLLIDLSAQYGHSIDKQDYVDRLAWANENLDYLETIYEDAEDKATFLACTIAVRDAQAGKPSGYTVGLDSLASGPQLLSVCTRCRTGMENTGVINTGHRPDVYTKLTDTMGVKEYSRADAKDALMP